MTKRAFIVRCSPSKISKVDYALKENQVVIGWSWTKDKLFDKNIDRTHFKEIIRDTYKGYKHNNRALGQATGYLWRFIKEMSIGDYVIVPIPKKFYIGKIIDEVKFYEEDLNKDLAIRRSVNWLNEKMPIERKSYFKKGFKNKLNYQGVCVEVSEFIKDIEDELKYLSQL